MKILETDRLVLRQLQSEDLDEFYKICGDPEIMRYVGDGQPLSREQTQRWIKKSQENYQKYGFGCSAVVAKEDAYLIGYCGFVNPTTNGEAEIIYGFKKQYWGQGLASEAVKAMLDFGLERCGLRRVIATIDPSNQASIRIVEKCGMTYCEQRLDEHHLPEVVYAIAGAGY
ncbi:GNAT family N-acetyltransferase [Synechococcus sp. C9]|jgi:ribosomal-protein-alanine N-acetyltransferase|uniref:GNAT family N-acetyltransferase n=1 Tax=Synechococcus sp. C9 TaxID=102119 RepID=UPI001FF2F97F|nr:GNAT family N-acetyltransferase [Synechococcus sp. C9]